MRGFRQDSGEALFLARQLEYIKPKVYQRLYDQHRCRTHFPVSFDAGKGREVITHRMISRRGRAAIGLGFPRINVAQQEYTTKVEPLTASYHYDVMQIRKAMNANQPGLNLPVELAYAARMAISEEENRLAYLGDAGKGINGAFTSREVAIQVAEFSLSDEATTSDQIISVFNRAINSVTTLSLATQIANYLLMPISLWTRIRTQPRSTAAGGNADTIFEYLQRAHPDMTFDWCTACTGAGIGGGDVMFVYNRSDDSITLEIPSEFEQLPEVLNDKGEYVTNCIEEFGGVRYIYASALLVEGI